MAKLLIVESPGKIKTLRKILGKDWILEASVGHTTELAHDGPKKLGFEIKNGQVATRYVPRGPRGRQVLAKLRAAVRKADQVYLATDPDREGEAIAWHLAEQLRLKRFVRVSYTQITENAVKAAIKNPRDLDLALVHAQRARQCLDKLVGFEVSPLLWNTSGGKSAGRVQSAALHLVCERERERLDFQPVDYWVLRARYSEGLTALYEPRPTPTQQGELNLRDGGRPNVKPGPGSRGGADRSNVVGGRSDLGDGDIKVLSASEAERIEQIGRAHPHFVTEIQDREEKRLPLPPLITSTLQQTAGVRLKFPPQKTMKLAQELYEGVGGKGLITYMRTDSVALSPEFTQEARAWLQRSAPEAMAERPPFFKTKADAQGAHEAIRPTSVELSPEAASQLLNRDQLALYRLIWERAVASQCRPARLSRSKVEISAGETLWIARGMRVLEAGYLKFWKNIENEVELPRLTKGQKLTLEGIEVERKTTQPPPRYSEAKLVQLMEKLGIGRPSTYASTVATLRERDYVALENSALAPTGLGMATDGVLSRAMPDLVDVGFTARMEESLDRIAENKISWEEFLCSWSEGYLRSALAQARVAVKDMPRREPASHQRSSCSDRRRSFR